MSEIKVHEFSERLVETYRRYLFTTNLICDSEPELRQEVWEKLRQQGIFTRSPLVTSIPAYKDSHTGADLAGRDAPPMLTDRLRQLSPKEFDLKRPLYEHQVEAIEKAQQGRNLIVATGTGSGKTECFLLPVLDDAVHNPEAGVRAIVIYPMNALANDQLDRMRRLLRDVPEITFGRYTGDTPRTMQEVRDEVRANIALNERFTREQIREKPPHILLTNFAMLEYLLLRPDDADVFRQQSLRFVVLDEAHTYNGAQGIDVSLLMRRLRQTYRNNELQFILTSATLAEGDTPEARSSIASFGSSLTGDPFAPQDIIFGSTVHSFDENCRAVELADILEAVPDEAALTRWLAALDDSGSLRTMIQESGLPNVSVALQATEPHTILYRLFRDWLPLSKVHQAVSERPSSFGHLTQMLWGEESERTTLALEWLMIMASHARAHDESVPLLPVRFHFFFRGLNGASVCLSPACEAKRAHPDTFWSCVYLENRARCDQPCESRLLPLSTCFQCGMPAVTVWVSEDGTWQPLPPSDKPEEAERRLSLTWDESLAEAGEEEEAEAGASNSVELCLSCGQFDESGRLFECCKTAARIRLRNLTPKGGELKQCPRCGTGARPYPSVLRDFRSGEEAATAVLAEQVMRSLPADSSGADALPANGRRMLAFSDSRQRAAFFAPYLKRTTAETEYAKPLYDALLIEEDNARGDPAMLEDVAKRFRKEALKRKLVLIRSYDRERDVLTYEIKPTRQLRPSDEKNLQRQAYISLLQNFCASARQRQNIPGLGLASAEIFLTPGAREDLPAQLPQVFDGGEEAGFDLIQQLLQLFLMRRALYIDDESILIEDIGPGPKNATFHYTFNDRKEQRQRYRWNPYAAEKKNRRTISSSFTAAVVSKFFGLDAERDGKQVDGLLEKIWESLRQTVLRPTAWGGEYQVKAEDIVLTTRRCWYVCEDCGRLTVFNVAQKCVAPGCEGRLRACDPGELERRFANHHYRHRLLKAEPLALEVVEHTAQITNEQGQIYQDKFLKGEINVLSSSTTFEMGVDVGQLKAVLLRNVPPSASNYIQRAGRAGRRRDGAAYAVTYARSLPHDQFYYHNPGMIVRGKVPVPQINLENRRLAQRHANSYLLGRFLRKLAPNEKVKDVADFFLTPDEGTSPAARFRGFVTENRGALLEALRRVLPEELKEILPADACLDASVVGLDTVFEEKVRRPLATFNQQTSELQGRQAEADANELLRIVRARESLDRLVNQLKRERIIDFLSSAHWLPSYAFPQDSIRLLVRQKDWSKKMRLERDREVGISEYAPGAEVIADGRVFKSRGVLRPGQGFDVRQYSYCRHCRRLVTKHENEVMEQVCECGLRSQSFKYIKPEGFQTFYSDEVPEPNLYRVRPPSNAELFLVSGARPEDFRAHERVEGVTYGYRKDGKLFRANPGYRFKQFRLCKNCGVSFEDKKTPRPHQTPWGTSCSGTVFRTHLAHEFETDTLQLRFDAVALGTPDVSDRDFWLSFQTAFVSAAAEALHIPRADLDATYQSQSSTTLEGEMIIYDKVPGGAGYVRRIIENLPLILGRTLLRTRNCDNPLCDPNGSCYTCLRSYGNQFYWDRLSRRKVFEWLESFVTGTTSDGADAWRASGLSTKEGRVGELRAYCDPRCVELLSICGERGLPLPDVGFELTDARGVVAGYAELAWPDKKVALLLPEQSELAQTFERGGWTIFSLSEEDALIRTLTDTRER
ncbi:MAG TPA: DEAD/DEAH box helicase [Pyrinomonadaceae bacterium]|jgi:hypothetical protein